jgi:formate dehydrogenase major subunit
MSEIKKIESVCTYCGVGCDIEGHVKDNKIEHISASPNGVVSEGNLCIKGKYGFDFVTSENRVTTPLIKKSFLEKNLEILSAVADSLVKKDDTWYEFSLDAATTAVTMKLKETIKNHGRHSIASIGGARTSCESAYLWQKFTRHTINSPHVDNCARVCHSPSLKGMRKTIGEGAATNPFNDIYETEFMVVMGSNTTEAHPIVANRMVKMAQQKHNLAVIEVRDIKLAKFSKYNAVIPHEANLLVLNMMAYVILEEELYNKEFVAKRTKWFDEYKNKILNDPYANPEYFKNLEGYAHLAKMIPNIAREYALKKSMFFWGLGITEHTDGSYAVMAITHLALLTGNIGKTGAGLMPLRGQNNVQGACDMGCLPYYNPDYQEPKEVGLMTPQLVDEMLEGRLKVVLNMGEDITHIHPNINKIEKAIEHLDMIVVQEVMMNDIAQKADIVIGVRSAYEKTGVYVNAMRRLHLSQPLVKSDLPDDWEVIKMFNNKMADENSENYYKYESSKDVWNEVREVAHRRFSGASYEKMERHRSRGLQWPVYHEDTPVLHLLDFRTDDGLGHFSYHGYKLRGMVEEMLNNQLGSDGGYHLTTGRTLAHYNNAAQTKESEKLNKRYDEDILLVCEDDKKDFTSEFVVLKTEFGETNPLRIKFTDKVKTQTLFTTFHHSKSRINAIFGDKSDELILTAAFKSIKVEIINQ